MPREGGSVLGGQIIRGRKRLSNEDGWKTSFAFRAGPPIPIIGVHINIFSEGTDHSEDLTTIFHFIRQSSEIGG